MKTVLRMAALAAAMLLTLAPAHADDWRDQWGLHAADNIGGTLFPRFKVTYGDDGSSTDVSATNPLPITGSWLTTQGGTPGIAAFIYDPATGQPLSATNPTQTFQSNSYVNITTKTTTTVKSGAGTLGCIVLNAAGSADSLTIYDNTAASGTVIGTITAMAADKCYNVAFGTGLTIVTGGTTAGNYTVTYR